MTVTLPEILSYHEEYYLYYLSIGIAICWVIQYFEMVHRKTLTERELHERTNGDAPTPSGIAVFIGICSGIPVIQYMVLASIVLILVVITTIFIVKLPTIMLGDTSKNNVDKK